jgi:dienelactone hydrolase
MLRDHPHTTQVTFRAPRVPLSGELAVPIVPRGVVVFARGSEAPACERLVATELAYAGFATFQTGLLTEAEQTAERTTLVRFDVRLLAERLVGALDWVRTQPQLEDLPIGIFGAGSGTAAALIASTHQPVAAIVSHGGRPDLASDVLAFVHSPLLLVVGGKDPEALERNHSAIKRLHSTAKLHTVCNAAHGFEEPGTAVEVARVAVAWFRSYLVVDRGVEHAGLDMARQLDLNEHAVAAGLREAERERDAAWIDPGRRRC